MKFIVESIIPKNGREKVYKHLKRIRFDLLGFVTFDRLDFRIRDLLSLTKTLGVNHVT